MSDDLKKNTYQQLGVQQFIRSTNICMYTSDKTLDLVVITRYNSMLPVAYRYSSTSGELPIYQVVYSQDWCNVTSLQLRLIPATYFKFAPRAMSTIHKHLAQFLAKILPGTSPERSLAFRH